ncbi:MAG: GyrI-like domain-containing protein [Acidobacteria bacterium]|nr:GyrI-like domain-containing protein [Acidobacteriota bacterium]
MRRILLIGICLILSFGRLYSGPQQTSEEAEEAYLIKEVNPFYYCCLQKKGPYSLMEKAIGELWLHMQKQGIHPTGTLFGIYINSPQMVEEAALEWLVAIPISDLPEPKAPLEKRKWSFQRVVSGIHTGPYDKVGETIEKMMNWLMKNGHAIAGPILERYLTIPTPDSDPTQYKTEIWIPIR